MAGIAANCPAAHRNIRNRAFPESGGKKKGYSEADYFHPGNRIGPNTYPNTNGYDGLGNASVSTGLVIEVLKIDPDGTAQIRLSVETPDTSLQLSRITPTPQAVPYPKDRPLWFRRNPGS